VRTTCLILSAVLALGGCKSSKFGLTVDVPVLGHAELISDPIGECKAVIGGVGTAASLSR